MKKPNKDNPSSKKTKDNKPNFPSKGLWLYVLFIVGLFVLLPLFNSSSPKEISWSHFEQNILAQNDVEKIIVVNREIAEIYIKKERRDDPKYEDIGVGILSSEAAPQYAITIGSVEGFENKLQKAQDGFSTENKVDIIYQNRTNWLESFSWILPFIIIILFWLFILRRMGSRGGMGSSPFNFSKTSARIIETEGKSAVTFNDVAGLKEAKVEVMEVVDFLKNPETYTKLGAKIPKGVMLVGPPGTGKTLLARAVAGEAKVPFFSMSGSEFVEMFVGVGASRVRDLFKQAKSKAPSIIFIDEIDAVGRSRGKGNALQSNDERESTLNQLLTELDGFGANTGVIVLAATNRPDVLDKALLRPGRFDRHIYLDLPNKVEREEIFQVHIRRLKLAEDVNIEQLATLSPGFSGADIANICNEAALIAARHKKQLIEHSDFIEARNRIIGGLERKSKIISPKEKKTIAYHEAGHAVVSWYLEHVDALLKVSIIPRGRSLGSTWYLPEERQIVTKSQFKDQICASLGGRAAEDLIFNEVSSGALDDLEKVTKQAYTMVAYYGLDKTIGPLSYYDSKGEYQGLLGKPYSEHTAKLIDNRVHDLINESYNRTFELLEKHKDELEKLAQLLLEKEVVYKEDLVGILGKRFIETVEKN
ncbi:ATP-dependent zinc metalloprotease FtsH [Oceanihabitans sp. IOP_32]|uniref:ATP-dependent zinc metalloprotease FtsH n=1 Tax=Oceanihabitans sp. IOP_32 TaxID=2529032 RepID=UPI001293559A|nr:ATP-dependent zinc metalloprotease FtsH [Oceanihabitans sp. IOP_32]QFZ53550.1 ATP-dependent zinc metalloprotease FtsH [Oceanihabitans sp. IOP_32]